jgi:hypothetical protein
MRSVLPSLALRPIVLAHDLVDAPSPRPLRATSRSSAALQLGCRSCLHAHDAGPSSRSTWCASATRSAARRRSGKVSARRQAILDVVADVDSQ